jgi:hypothetical protein
MVKVPYEILSVAVEKLYAKKFPEGDHKAIEEHCLTIQALIEGSGWDTDEYLNRWFSKVQGKQSN